MLIYINLVQQQLSSLEATVSENGADQWVPITFLFFFFKQYFKEMPKIGNHRKPASWWPNV